MATLVLTQTYCRKKEYLFGGGLGHPGTAGKSIKAHRVWPVLRVLVLCHSSKCRCHRMCEGVHLTWQHCGILIVPLESKSVWWGMDLERSSRALQQFVLPSSFDTLCLGRLHCVCVGGGGGAVDTLLRCEKRVCFFTVDCTLWWLATQWSWRKPRSLAED